MSAKKEEEHKWKRALTISSATPLRHKDKHIPEAKREKFQGLDLEVLLGEFKAVALVKESQASAGDDPEGIPISEEGYREKEWLENAGLSSLTEKIEHGEAITAEDLKSQTAGLTPLQVHAVKERCLTLNSTLKQREAKKRADSRSLFSDKPLEKPADKSDKPPPAPSQLSQTQPLSPSSSRPLSSLDVMSDTFDIDPETRQKLAELMTPPESMIKFSDLGIEDQEHVQCLILIQLTSILEAQNSSQVLKQTTKPKPKKKKVVGTFDEDLDLLIERDRAIFGDRLKDANVPMFFQCALESLAKHGVKEEGIFRKAGAAARIKMLRQKCEDLKGDVNFEALGALPHDVSALVKSFVRDLPEPILTAGFIEAFACTQQFEDTDLQFYTLQLLVMLLPPVHRECLLALLRFLALVAANHEHNKMSLSNLAVVFAPTLFYIKGHKGEQMLKEIEIQVSSATTLKTMIEYHDQLLIVPPDVLAQLRFLNETNRSARKASKPKQVKKLFSRAGKSKGEEDKPTVRWQDKSDERPPVRGIATVTFADSANQIEFKLTDQSTAGDVLKAASCDPHKFFLVERGGNIGLQHAHEADTRSLAAGIRKLHVGDNIMAVFKINKACQLQICSSNSVLAQRD